MHVCPGSPRVSVIVPTKNEAGSLEALPPDMPDVHEVVLVDTGSRDGTIGVTRRHLSNLQIINQTRTSRGNALVCGVQAATGDIVVTPGTDGFAGPYRIPTFVDTLVRGTGSARGSWCITGGGSVDLTRLRSAGNWGSNVLSNLSLDTESIDLYYSYNAFRKDIIPALRLSGPNLPQPVDSNHLRGDGLETKTLITVRVAQAGLAVTEVPSFELDRIHDEGNLCTFTDGQQILHTIATEAAHHDRAKHTYLIAALARHHLPTCRLRSREWEHLNI